MFDGFLIVGILTPVIFVAVLVIGYAIFGRLLMKPATPKVKTSLFVTALGVSGLFVGIWAWTGGFQDTSALPKTVEQVEMGRIEYTPDPDEDQRLEEEADEIQEESMEDLNDFRNNFDAIDTGGN